MQIDIDWTAIIGSACVAASAAWMAWQQLRGKKSATAILHVVDGADGYRRSSDQKPPEGFIDHVGIIVAAAPTATPETVLGYLAAGLTEAETLRSEVVRMGGAKP